MESASTRKQVTTGDFHAAIYHTTSRTWRYLTVAPIAFVARTLELKQRVISCRVSWECIADGTGYLLTYNSPVNKGHDHHAGRWWQAVRRT